MDGSDPVNIGGTDHMIPNGIAIDFEGKSFVFLNLQCKFESEILLRSKCQTDI